MKGYKTLGQLIRKYAKQQAILPNIVCTYNDGSEINKFLRLDQLISTQLTAKDMPEPTLSINVIDLYNPSAPANYAIPMGMSSTVTQLKQAIQSKMQHDPATQSIYCSNQLLSDASTLNHHLFISNTTVVLIKGVSLKIHDSFFDSDFDYRFNAHIDNTVHLRGGMEYKRPSDYKRYAIRVKRMYGSADWLGMANKMGEWGIAYIPSDFDAISKKAAVDGISIDIGPICVFNKLLSIHNWDDAAKYLKPFDYNKKRYQAMIQVRVEPGTTMNYEDNSMYLSNLNCVRPYALLVRKL
jgi:hypothetical protein